VRGGKGKDKKIGEYFFCSLFRISAVQKSAILQNLASSGRIASEGVKLATSQNDRKQSFPRKNINYNFIDSVIFDISQMFL
jgi:hypothetical protein